MAEDHVICVAGWGGVKLAVSCDTCGDVLMVIEAPSVALEHINRIAAVHQANPHRQITAEPLGGPIPGVTGHLPEEED